MGIHKGSSNLNLGILINSPIEEYNELKKYNSIENKIEGNFMQNKKKLIIICLIL